MEQQQQGPLAGLVVIELGHSVAAPFAGQILGDLGADVIKVEAPNGRGSETPTAAAPHPWNAQALFNKLNRNKRSIALDLKQERGREVFRRLVADADVVIENFSPRAMVNLGLGHEQLREINRRLIYVAMPAYGLSGPRRDYIGFGSSIEPSSGLSAVMGYSATEPRSTLTGVTDAMAATLGVGALIEALQRARDTGEGATLELAQQQAGIAFIGEHLIERQMTGREPERRGNRHAVFAPHGVYRCAGDDHWISIGVRTEAEWSSLSELAGRGWATDPRFTTLDTRRVHHAELDVAIESWTSGQEKWELAGRLQQRGIPAGPVLSAPEWLGDRHLQERGYWVELDHPETGHEHWDGSPIRSGGDSRTAAWKAAPALGGDNDAVLRGLLGMNDTEINALWDAGVIVDRPPA